MISIYCLNHSFLTYANNVKDMLSNNNIFSVIINLEGHTLNKALREDKQLYRIIIGYYDVQNNNICIRDYNNQVYNMNINHLVDFIKNNA